MKVTLANDPEAIDKTWQSQFERTAECVACAHEAVLAFVAHEGVDPDDRPKLPRAEGEVQYLCNFRPKELVEGDLWMHDCAAFAVYMCPACMHVTTVWNQA